MVAPPKPPSDATDERGIGGPLRPPAAGDLLDYAHAIWVPAHPGNFRKVTPPAPPRVIKNVVIHITDGGGSAAATAAYFHREPLEKSVHYVVGQKGEVIQMVREADVAWHAHLVNAFTIGIEHEARTKGDDRDHPEPILPTPALYAASAALVADICDRHRLPRDRTSIQGHKQIDKATTHDDCPDGVWDWDLYMRLVNAVPRPGAPVAAAVYELRRGATGKEVIILRRALERLGFRCGAEGGYGAELEAAVSELQREQALPVTGVADALFLWKVALLVKASGT